MLTHSIAGLNCIITAYGIVTLCKRPYSMQVGSGLVRTPPAYCTAVYRGWRSRDCGDTIRPPEDEQLAARNMLRIVV